MGDWISSEHGFGGALSFVSSIVYGSASTAALLRLPHLSDINGRHFNFPFSVLPSLN
ncbi:hypothetical protein LguiA_015218 [Lonicera macranthoides]